MSGCRTGTLTGGTDEASLPERFEHLRVYVQHAPVAVAMFDREMRYLAVSRRWLSDYGLAGDDLTGRSHYGIFPEIPDRWREAHRRGIAGEILSCSEDRFERGDGRVQWLRWEIRPWRDGTGEAGIVLFTEDITERHDALDRVERLNADLERSVLELSRDLLPTITTQAGEPAEIEVLRGATPICSHCKSIRTDTGIWQQPEPHLLPSLGTRFTHGICPNCIRKYFGEVPETLSSPELSQDEGAGIS